MTIVYKEIYIKKIYVKNISFRILNRYYGTREPVFTESVQK